MMTELLTVVVCSYNGANKIDTCLEALAKQNVRVPVVVVDDGSTDAVADVASGFEGVEVVRLETNVGLSAARNIGVEYAKSEFVAFCDDDCIPPAEWTELLIAAWTKASDGTMGLGGVVVAAEYDSLNQRYMGANNPLRPLDIKLAQNPSFLTRLKLQLAGPNRQHSYIHRVYSLVGANMSFRKSAINAVGGFNNSIHFGGDEEYLCVELRKQFGDSCLLVDPAIVMRHSFESPLRDTWRRSLAYGRGSGRRWVLEGDMPSIPPVGATAIAVTIMLAPFSLAGAFVAGLIVGISPRGFWWREALRTGRPEYSVYPVLALSEDVCNSAGFALGAANQLFRYRKGKS